MSRKTRTKSKTRNNAKSRAKKATVSTVKSTDTEETVIPTAEPAIIKEEVAQPEPKEEIKIEMCNRTAADNVITAVKKMETI